MFLDGEVDEDMSAARANTLELFEEQWPHGATADEVAVFINRCTPKGAELLGCLNAIKPTKETHSRTVTWQLRAMQDTPTMMDDRIAALKFTKGSSNRAGKFRVVDLRGAA